ncbi:MAG TPA: hypothetical protein GYA06_00590 [Chloroflexi bacterium]|jgi:hypothetical protein|nr:hypothetical protein [Chloroflexota bacterium]
MPTQEERLKILTMLQDGQIDARQAAKLLEALGDDQPGPEAQPSAHSTHSGGARWLRVRVTDTDSGKTRVNVRLPIGLVSSGLRLGMRFAPEVAGLDPDMLIEALRSGEMGQIVDVHDEEDGERVEVFIE